MPNLPYLVSTVREVITNHWLVLTLQQLPFLLYKIEPIKSYHFGCLFRIEMSSLFLLSRTLKLEMMLNERCFNFLFSLPSLMRESLFLNETLYMPTERMCEYCNFYDVTLFLLNGSISVNDSVVQLFWSCVKHDV